LIRYAIYTRQSVARGDDLGSCEVQFMTCRDAARAEGDRSLHWTGQRFDDAGCSGATLDRPAMRKLRKVIDLVLVGPTEHVSHGPAAKYGSIPRGSARHLGRFPNRVERVHWVDIQRRNLYQGRDTGRCPACSGLGLVPRKMAC
jgi:hypothetical protein